jgi:hypothetical protein
VFGFRSAPGADEPLRATAEIPLPGSRAIPNACLQRAPGAHPVPKSTVTPANPRLSVLRRGRHRLAAFPFTEPNNRLLSVPGIPHRTQEVAGSSPASSIGCLLAHFRFHAKAGARHDGPRRVNLLRVVVRSKCPSGSHSPRLGQLSGGNTV